MPKIIRRRMFEIMQYYEHFNNEQLDNVFYWLEKVNCKYLAVKHDKDEKESHFHIYVQLEDARAFDDIARQCKIKKQYIQKIEKGFDNALAYAFHLSESAKNDGKYLYDESAVIRSKGVDVSAIFAKNEEIEEKKNHKSNIKALMLKYGECEISKRDLLDKINASDYNDNALLMKKMREYRQLKVRERNMQVIYICGESGSGKTTFAKYMARLQNYDYFVSGSGKDVLDGYDKEECIILDDFRADAFTKAELFKLTDNNTNSSVKSRYQNKDISYCKLMVITSIKTPHTLYNWETYEDKDETFKQFARRINNCFIYIANNGDLWECRYEDTDKPTNPTLKKKAPFTMQEVFAVLGIERRIGGDVMSRIYEAVLKDVQEHNESTNDGADDLPF